MPKNTRSVVKPTGSASTPASPPAARKTRKRALSKVDEQEAAAKKKGRKEKEDEDEKGELLIFSILHVIFLPTMT